MHFIQEIMIYREFRNNFQPHFLIGKQSLILIKNSTFTIVLKMKLHPMPAFNPTPDTLQNHMNLKFNKTTNI